MKVKLANAQRTYDQLWERLNKLYCDIAEISGDENPQVIATCNALKAERDFIARVLASLEGDRTELSR